MKNPFLLVLTTIATTFAGVAQAEKFTIGEFGVILMLGGSIPGETKVLSVLIYDHSEAMNYEAAHRLSAMLLVFAFFALFVVYSITRRFEVAKV